jgi:hypothetical protein
MKKTLATLKVKKDIKLTAKELQDVEAIKKLVINLECCDTFKR